MIRVVQLSKLDLYNHIYLHTFYLDLVFKLTCCVNKKSLRFYPEIEAVPCFMAVVAL